MPETLNIESDEFLRLLTDALRAGPGSPEWRQAVQQLRGKKDHRDEYALLCQAREHLESGKSYRSVVAGAGFTKKVLAGIEQEDEPAVQSKIEAPPTANLVALISILVLIGVVAVVAYFMLPGGDPNRTALEDLAKVYFPTVPAAGFHEGAPAGWRKIGELPTETTRDARLIASTQPLAGAKPRGGGAVIGTPLSPTEPVAVEVSVAMPEASRDLIAQVFVTDDPNFSPDRATAPRELVWMLRDDRSMVFLPNDRPAPGAEAKVAPSPDPFTVRIVMNRDVATIDAAGTRLFAGSHQLSPEKPRYVGVRFVRTGPNPAPVAFTSVKIQRPQATR